MAKEKTLLFAVLSSLFLVACAPVSQYEADPEPNRQMACDEVDSYLKESGDTLSRMIYSIESDNPESLSRYADRLVDISYEIQGLDVGNDELAPAVTALASSIRELGLAAPADDTPRLVAANDEFQISLNRLGRLCDWPPLQY